MTQEFKPNLHFNLEIIRLKTVKIYGTKHTSKILAEEIILNPRAVTFPYSSPCKTSLEDVDKKCALRAPFPVPETGLRYLSLRSTHTYLRWSHTAIIRRCNDSGYSVPNPTTTASEVGCPASMVVHGPVPDIQDSREDSVNHCVLQLILLCAR
ncbi:hypothetical protein SISSUDRAFT_1047531 [Sistotremastrum suecicum HHB10207 ss-3]|uniref:Uncharacterized protein n=1 Tax=Sistotremastrum suecicum HHB10207 ss-3 TaxID=1314776 RepID=A0A166D2G9_9AGAM|nr:hypothetical protein SISSUDRAFT_1047531 [Sistotremastrum suecicum HHB10207 ss-3]